MLIFKLNLAAQYTENISGGVLLGGAVVNRIVDMETASGGVLTEGMALYLEIDNSNNNPDDPFIPAVIYIPRIAIKSRLMHKLIIAKNQSLKRSYSRNILTLS